MECVLDYEAVAQIVLCSVGRICDQFVLRKRGTYSENEFMHIMRHGVVGDIIGYYNIKGKYVSNPLEVRIIGLSLDELKWEEQSHESSQNVQTKRLKNGRCAGTCT